MTVRALLGPMRRHEDEDRSPSWCDFKKSSFAICELPVAKPERRITGFRLQCRGQVYQLDSGYGSGEAGYCAA